MIFNLSWFVPPPLSRDSQYQWGPCTAIKFSVCFSFVVFHPSAGPKWLITVNKSCARGPLVNIPWLLVENHWARLMKKIYEKTTPNSQ